MSKKNKAKKTLKTEKSAVITGAYIFPNGDKYDGSYILTAEGSIERSGFGKHTTPDGITYEGQWEKDKMNGHGRLEQPSGSVYIGHFVNNQFHGEGKYTWPNGCSYLGQFVENRLEGDGQFVHSNGQAWFGTFHYKTAPGLRFLLNMD